MKFLISFLLLGVCILPCSVAEPKQEKPAQSIPELRQQIEKILKDTHTPGVSIAIVHRDGPEWVAGLGLADVATNREATADTLFRIGSTSKAFASMSILLLRDQGKLSLDEPVRQLAPEVWFENRWEATDPVRVVNLLEHTTGWDDMHLREYSKQWPDSQGLREALDFDHHSRVSRWPPGTRMAYCNSGPPVAAYIVEKISGRRFEDFVQQNLFGPIGMNTATYFVPAPGTATTLYHDDGKTPYGYWHILLRPAGSINASALDMAHYVQFYLNRGMVDGKQVLPAADIDRMESPTSTWGAKDGLRAGYGLSNYWSFHEGFIWHGHNGGVEGGLTDMSYMPDYGVGYFYSINSGNGNAFNKIGKAIRAYITRSLQQPAVPPAGQLPANAASYAGWYLPDSSRIQLFEFMDRLLGASRVHMQNGKLRLRSINGTQTFIPVAGEQFRYVPDKDPAEPEASVVLLSPNAEGQFVQFGPQTMKRIPTWWAVLRVAATVYVLLAIVSIILYAPFWILGGLRKKRRRPAERAMRLWPLLSVLSLFVTIALFISSMNDPFERLGVRTGWSEALCAMTIAFAVSAIVGFAVAWRTRSEQVRAGVRRYSLCVSVALLIATLYLGYYGIIGVRTWA